jgi:threonine/homoserine/homoserine lactone efflux protein
MLRSILGFAIFAVLAFFALNLVLGLLGIAFGLAFKLLSLAALGFLVYLALRIISPSTADRIRDTIRGRPADG